MIVKKMPILQGFPDFETVKFFTGKFFQKYNFTPVFYDIETTGLSRNSTYLYLIGAVGIEDETWYFYQWMAENASEEETILRIFSQFLQQYNLMISYNGERFDQPYLEARYEKYGIPSPFTGKQSLDLYLILKPLKSLLKLPAMKQPCMEEFLGIKDRIYDNGKECIKLYKDFLKKEMPLQLMKSLDITWRMCWDWEEFLICWDIFASMMEIMKLHTVNLTETT